ncbi:hypothetical protein [Janthinobacterium sp. SUN033]|uniref:hypothetical protein n=1 Tax=Janthinobacterium sp. SUN033 TaxID=3002439 RepID=UPI0025B0BCF8|nr:hypothetical protein [Janthinobacterium sp. SUN033]MDN2675401.1 hypothetical protein [Janthinobacterium sp. SUN033]
MSKPQAAAGEWRMRLIVWLQLQQIMHGMKIDVKRKIYLVSIDKIDNTWQYSLQQRLLLPIIVCIAKNIQRYPAPQITS